MDDWIDPSNIDVPPEILKLVPVDVAHENLALPLRLEGEMIVLAVEDPFDFEKMDRLRFILNREDSLIGALSKKLWLAIWRLYGPPSGGRRFGG